jgi:hypothetical protein
VHQRRGSQPRPSPSVAKRTAAARVAELSPRAAVPYILHGAMEDASRSLAAYGVHELRAALVVASSCDSVAT